MNTEDFKRKLTAILSADVKGYSRLMGEDELATVQTLEAYREEISNIVSNYNGRVVDSPGDNILAEFYSVVNAVECGVEIQKALKAQNQDLPENRRMEFRIGINLGDVIEQGERIYGDGVNIAARIEGLAEAGGVCISRTAYDQVKNKLPLGYEYLGEHRVKNIKDPVGVYRVLMDPDAAGSLIYKRRKDDPRHKLRATLIAVLVLIIAAGSLGVWYFYLRPPSIEPVSIDKMGYPLPKEPSIAVMPFDNLSGDPDQEYFVDGMTDDLITDLSKISGLFVIARNSVFTYKGKAVKIDQVSRELGVRYVLEGSVRKVGQQVRINAQLIDAIKGHHLWAERYDGNLSDVFSLQDRITHKIVTALTIKLSVGESGLINQKDTDSIKAYDAYLKAVDHHLRWTPEDAKRAVFYYRKAIELDPGYSRAYAGLGDLLLNAHMGWTEEDIIQFYKNVPGYLKKAMNKPNVQAYVFSATIKRLLHLLDEAIVELRLAMTLFPNNPNILIGLAQSLNMANKPKEAIALAEKAMRLDPRFIANSLYNIGISHYAMRDSERAVSYFQRSYEYNPEFSRPLFYLAAAYSDLGQIHKARETIQQFIDLSQHKSVALKTYRGRINFDDPELNELLAKNLLKAGLEGKAGDYDKIYTKNRIIADEIKELLQDAEGFDYSIEADMICARWKLFGDCCRPVFRNPDGREEEHNRYFLTSYSSYPDLFSTSDDLSDLIEPKTQKWETPFMRWSSEDDGLCKDGLCIRKNSPSFSFKYPSGYTVEKGMGKGTNIDLVCSVRGKIGSPRIHAAVGHVRRDFNQTVSQVMKNTQKAWEYAGAINVKIIYSKPLPSNIYGRNYPAQEYEMEMKWEGGLITCYYNVIAKNDYYIEFVGLIPRDSRDSIDEVIKPIFHSIDLQP